MHIYTCDVDFGNPILQLVLCNGYSASPSFYRQGEEFRKWPNVIHTITREQKLKINGFSLVTLPTNPVKTELNWNILLTKEIETMINGLQGKIF